MSVMATSGRCSWTSAQQAVGVFRRAGDLDAGVAKEAHDPLTGEHDVLGDDYPHGSSRSSAGRAASVSALSRPRAAPARSARWSETMFGLAPSSTIRAMRRPSLPTDLHSHVRGSATGRGSNGFVDHDVRRALAGRQAAPADVADDLYRHRRSIGKIRKRRAQAGLDEDRGEDPVREVAQVLQDGRGASDEVFIRAGEVIVSFTDRRGPAKPKLVRDREQPLLRTVVKVPLDLEPGGDLRRSTMRVRDSAISRTWARTSARSRSLSTARRAADPIVRSRSSGSADPAS